MPKQTSEKKTCSKCNLEHPATWFKPYKLKDKTMKRSDHCKLCTDSKGSLPSVETWCEQMYKEVVRDLEPESQTPAKHVQAPLRRTIRFKYYGSQKSEWLELRDLLLSQHSKLRTEFLTKWAKAADLVLVDRVEAAIGVDNTGGKNLRITRTHDIEDASDIIITNINPDDRKQSYDSEWSVQDLVNVIKAFKEVTPVRGDITSTIETHVE
jgi:hypothetical protein